MRALPAPPFPHPIIPQPRGLPFFSTTADRAVISLSTPVDNFARAAGENFTAPLVQFHVRALPAPPFPYPIILQPRRLPFFSTTADRAVISLSAPVDHFARAAGENFTAPLVQFHVRALPAPPFPYSIIPQPRGLPFFSTTADRAVISLSTPVDHFARASGENFTAPTGAISRAGAARTPFPYPIIPQPRGLPFFSTTADQAVISLSTPVDNFARAAGENFTAPLVQFHVRAPLAPLFPYPIIPQPHGLPFFSTTADRAVISLSAPVDHFARAAGENFTAPLAQFHVRASPAPLSPIQLSRSPAGCHSSPLPPTGR